jgi:hypothetical protein
MLQGTCPKRHYSRSKEGKLVGREKVEKDMEEIAEPERSLKKSIYNTQITMNKQYTIYKLQNKLKKTDRPAYPKVTSDESPPKLRNRKAVLAHKVRLEGSPVYLEESYLNSHRTEVYSKFLKHNNLCVLCAINLL